MVGGKNSNANQKSLFSESDSSTLVTIFMRPTLKGASCLKNEYIILFNCQYFPEEMGQEMLTRKIAVGVRAAASCTLTRTRIQKILRHV